MNKKIILFILLSLSYGMYGFSQQYVIQRNDTIRDNNIVAPESMTENLSKLLYDWQLNFSATDAKCKNGVNVNYPDSVYVRRLVNLPTTMELSYNSVVQKYIDIYAADRRSQVSYMLALGEYYFPIFEQILDKYGLPLELKYLPVIESALNPVAVSHAGATGLWQFMLPTGQSYGLEINSLVDERRDPYRSSEAAARYLKDLYAIYGDWNLVIAAYNCGAGTVNKAIQRSGGRKDYWAIYYNLPRETRGYVPAFIAANYIMNYYPDHKICPMNTNSFSGLDTIQVRREFHLEQIAQVLNVPIANLRRLNPQFRKDIVPGNFKPYTLVLPTTKMLLFLAKNQDIIDYRRDELFSHRANTEQFIQNKPATPEYVNTYHTVKKGETLSAIAKNYRVSVSQLKSWNGLRKNRVSRGKRLIVKRTLQRVEVEEPLSSENDAQKETLKDDSSVATTGSNLNPTSMEEDDEEEMDAPATKTATKTKIQNKYYTVKSGDNLDRIARKHKLTVNELKKMNGLKKTTLQPGTKLIVGKSNVTVTEKSTKKATSKTKKKKRR